MTGRLLPLLAVLGLAGCATAVEPVGGAEIDGDYTVSGARFDTGTVIDFAIRPREADGRLALCGAYTVRNPTAQTIPYTARALASGQVQIEGETVLRDPTRFNRLDEDAVLLGAQARCLATETPWRAGFAAAKADTRFVRQTFDRDEEDTSGGGIIFRERR
ncbi:MAG: hypothetical protein ACFBWO_17890 [Paracoccaceae bacterium]